MTTPRTVLTGVRRRSAEFRPGPPDDRVRAVDEIVYTVRDSPVRPASQTADHRVAPRRRTRLRSGKILLANGAFLCHCRIHDRSATGMRLALAKETSLPRSFIVFEDETMEPLFADVVWRRGLLIGVRLPALDRPDLKPSDRHALSRRYYAVPNR